MTQLAVGNVRVLRSSRYVKARIEHNHRKFHVPMPNLILSYLVAKLSARSGLPHRARTAINHQKICTVMLCSSFRAIMMFGQTCTTAVPCFAVALFLKASTRTAWFSATRCGFDRPGRSAFQEKQCFVNSPPLKWDKYTECYTYLV